MNPAPPPLPAPDSDSREPLLLVSAAGRFALFFLWLIPTAIAVVFYYLWIIGIQILQGGLEVESALVLGGVYFVILIVLGIITGMISAVSATRASKRQVRILWGTTLFYILINLFAGPLVAIGWWYVSQRM